MTRPKFLTTKAMILVAAGITLAAVSASQPVSAQVPCPPGYYYSYGYGCVPVAPAYGYMYGPGYAYVPPVYDSFGLAFGFGGGGRGGGRGGGGRGGGGRGGGGHGGGHR